MKLPDKMDESIASNKNDHLSSEWTLMTSKTLRRALLGERGMVEEARLLSTTSSMGQLPSFPKTEFLQEENQLFYCGQIVATYEPGV